MLSKLREIVEKQLNKEIPQQKKTQLELIKKILADDNCFFKIDAQTACNIISDLGFSREDTIDIYKELISSKNFN